jgi:hypothetical protein
MTNKKINDVLDKYTLTKNTKTISKDRMEKEECDIQTGECYTIRSKDGIVERINKKFIIEDGRQLLQD